MFKFWNRKTTDLTVGETLKVAFDFSILFGIIAFIPVVIICWDEVKELVLDKLGLEEKKTDGE